MKKTIIMIIMLLSLVTSAFAAGIGVSPSTIKFENALKGTTYIKEFKIDNTAEQEIIATLSINEHKDWIKFSPGMNVRVPAKSSEIVKVTLSIPKETVNGEYEAKVSVEGKPAEEAGGMGLIPGAAFTIKMDITDEVIIKGFVDNILTRDTAMNENVKFIVGFMNQGNVIASPNAEITIKDENEEVIDKITKKLDEVGPSS
ncbi:MAG: hypothetical protein ABIG89_00375, partial [Candidatus Woesearchaeota archaeon]